MLEVSRPSGFVEIEHAPLSGAASGNAVLELVGFLRRQRQIIIAATCVGALLGILYYLSAAPTYKATATLIIDARRSPFTQQQSILGDALTDSASVESQVEVLKSENVALAVIKAKKLTEDPEFVGGRSGIIGPLFSWLFGTFDDSSAESQNQLATRALRAFATKLSVRRIGLSYVLEIGFVSDDSAKSAEIANAVGDAYIADLLESKFQTTQRASGWLQDRIKELRQQATTADRAVQTFKTRNNIVDTARGGSLNEQQVSDANTQLAQARANMMEAKARYDRLSEVLDDKGDDKAGSDKAGGDKDGKEAIPDGTITDSLRSDLINRMRAQYVEASKREAEWSARYGRDNIAAAKLRDDMQEIRRNIVLELRRIAEAYKNDYNVALSREASAKANLDNIVSKLDQSNQDRVQLRELESAAQTFRTLYDTFLHRYMESIQQQSFPITEARIITFASPPQSKNSPKGSIVLPAGILFGVALGFGIAFFRERIDRVFRDAATVEQITGVSCLGVLPALSAPAEANAGTAPASLPARQVLPAYLGLMRYISEAPFSRFVETLRGVKLSLDLWNLKNDARTIGIVSAIPGEGKSTIASNFAQLLAQTGARTVLVDLDLRNPSLTRTVAARAEGGVLEVISGSAALEDVLLTDPVTGLHMLPAVTRGVIPHTSEIVSSDPALALLARLRRDYEFVIVDLPPLAPVVDARAVASAIDGFLLVIRWGKTRQDTLASALASSGVVHSRVIGALLNNAKISTLKRYENYSGEYQYGGYHTPYLPKP